MSEPPREPRPGEFSALLQALEASEGRRRRRKRDTTPDSIGLAIKHDLLRQAAAEDPAPDTFESWLLGKALASQASGPVRALCAEILDEYRFARADPGFGRWLRPAWTARAASSARHSACKGRRGVGVPTHHNARPVPAPLGAEATGDR